MPRSSAIGQPRTQRFKIWYSIIKEVQNHSINLIYCISGLLPEDVDSAISIAKRTVENAFIPGRHPLSIAKAAIYMVQQAKEWKEKIKLEKIKLDRQIFRVYVLMFHKKRHHSSSSYTFRRNFCHSK